MCPLLMAYIHEISRVIVFTHDVRALADFYRSRFGLDTVGENSDEWAELAGGSCNIAFHKYFEHVEGRDGWI